MSAAPRLYCIPATSAPVVAVFRRGPSDWSHVGRWWIDTGEYEAGAWLHGRLFPRRSDVSPDGRYLCYFAHAPGAHAPGTAKPHANWPHGDAYIAISRLPWLKALHAFATDGTWTRGYHFAAPDDDPAHAIALPMPYALQPTPPIQFATERQHGWGEAPDCPPRDPQDVWDQHRNAILIKRQPGGERELRVESLGWPGGEFGRAQAVDGLRVRYHLIEREQTTLLHDLQWADWTRDGALLLATRDGHLQRRRLDPQPQIEYDIDLSALTPAPQPAPEWAAHW
ncbi:hypothetical protein E4T66_20865 [Sinimarinibacterium sp. CAU 1509]|uniref:hypothetical protein n=1 Tax=Sinimarinibacterium sp. CAU 1509 TaxID=2562283 RepID=UPI0010AC44A0|nr:hypothetical protein [Sinimarinibacterium sp. CAU 1509]TJY55564.1 hypothetical protein E4T66_20865 [Sinimarinibacterium sp. CAU 1509]